MYVGNCDKIVKYCLLIITLRRRKMRAFRTRKLYLVMLLVTLGVLGLVTVTLVSDLNVEGEMPVWQPMLHLFGLHNSSNANDIACYFYDYKSNAVVVNEVDDKENTDTGKSTRVQKANVMKELWPDAVPRDTSIFFHETSCHQAASPLLMARQACAVESAAKMNPHSQVYLLFPSPISNSNYSLDTYVKQLNSYSNIHLRHINIERYFEGSPLEEWFKTGYLFTSQWPRSHASDLLRYLTLWKFGGIYLDLDVVVVKSLEDLTNFAGAESDTAVAAGVMSFSANGTGHQLATTCLDDLKANFNGHDWGNNGPGVITRVLKKTCKVTNVKDMTPERCRDFHVYPPSWFYPISWKQWHVYFDANANQTVMNKLWDSHIIHVWNKFSTSTSVNVTSTQPYGVFAAKFCPKVFGATKNTF